jgi:hypothetical protein
MKRRELIIASAVGIVGSGRAAQPCPPPSVTAGGSTATTNCPTATAESYFTSFDSTENPLTEGGKWINGQAVGGQWSNVQTATGNAFASRFVDTGTVGRYSDPIAHLSTSFLPFKANQYAQGVVHRVPGYRNSIGKHEIELLLRFQISANNARGYEVLWGQDGEIVIVRWNGPVGNYTALGGIGDAASNMAVDGDTLRAEIVGNVIKVFRNGALMVSAVDSTYPTGQPGVGFWPTPGATLSAYGWKSFQAGAL